MSRLPVMKTHKLLIGGAFVRSESGRTFELGGEHYPKASRKDIRDAVRAARNGYERWAGLTAYNRGQVIYRLAEMLEGRREQLARTCSGPREVERAIDNVVWYAGWPDKLAQILGSVNSVSGSFLNFTVPEPIGVVGLIAPIEPPLEGLLSRLLPVLVAGNSAVAVCGEPSAPVVSILGEAIATADIPAGTVNLLTGDQAQLARVLAAHRGVGAIDVTDPGMLQEVGELASAGITRVSSPVDPLRRSLGCIESFVEFKTVWHPKGF